MLLQSAPQSMKMVSAGQRHVWSFYICLPVHSATVWRLKKAGFAVQLRSAASHSSQA
jgi:hypothetical protein